MDKYKIPYVKTFEYTKIIGMENISFGKYIIIDDFVLIYAKMPITLGNHVHISSFTSISGGGEFIMEDFSGLASGCRIITSSDDFKHNGFGNPTLSDSYRNIRMGSVHIKRFAIVGANSVILPHVTIGEGASIAAGSVISKDLEAWGIYIGNRRVGWRDKEKVLENYENFKSVERDKQLGTLFCG